MSTVEAKPQANKTADRAGVRVTEPNAKQIVVSINGATSSGTPAKGNGKGSKGKEVHKKTRIYPGESTDGSRHGRIGLGQQRRRKLLGTRK